MKDWFKYEYGYVNLDDRNIYLTNSGNWSDTIDLREYEKKTSNHLPSKGLIYLVIVGIIFLLLFFMNIITGKISLVLLVGLPLAGVAVYDYMKSEIGDKYLIPYSKINSIEFLDKTVTINYNDFNGLTSKCELRNVSQAGLKKMEAIQKLAVTNNG